MKYIQKILLAIALFALAPAAFGQDFDLKALDRLGANAKSTTNVTLNKTMLRWASAFLGADGDSDAAAIKSLIANLRAIYVRSYRYDRPGQYSDADLAPIRAMLSQPKWMAAVDVKESGQTNQIYFLEGVGDKLGGVAVLNIEPTAVTVVYIDGELDPGDIAKLSGNMGIPSIDNLDNLKSSGSKKKDRKAAQQKDDNKSKNK